MTTAQAITTALLQREKTGEGQYLPVSILGSALYYNWPDLIGSRTPQGEGIVDAVIVRLEQREENNRKLIRAAVEAAANASEDSPPARPRGLPIGLESDHTFPFSDNRKIF